ncbi:hypothetical protein D9757_003790 [Collybiopsis confluens]|uniref:Uncharacterized protein n=1 Tax=Collybiopsis confluens TaxID=2823264 RepID=A0A8H5HV58_9AGAR|nr:hypothetical protein D9757_003790 [Collybiopsis confluens]
MSSNPHPQPYPGAPPIPQGYNVNPTLWSSGVWQRNPHFNWNQGSAQPPQASWVPGAAWNQSQSQPQPQPQQQQQSYNPYKRVINPPSASYLAQKLSDNPLGLTNMIPREELYGPGVDGALPETPWIWAPRTLDDENPHSSNSRQSSEPPPSSASQDPSHSFSRHASEPPSDSREYAPAPLARPKKYAVSASAQAAAAVAASSTSKTPQPPPPISSASAYASNRANPSSTTSSSTTPISAATTITMTPSRALRPTFSTRIVRTPDHYRAGQNDGNVNSALARSATMPSVTTAMNQMSVSNNATAGQSQTTPSRSQSTSQATRRSTSASGGSKINSNSGSENITDASVFVDEPGTLLSPLVMETPMPHTTRPLGRNQTEPALSSIPESSSKHSHHQSRHHHRHRSSSRNDSSNGSTPLKSKTPTPATAQESGNRSYFSRTSGTSSASAAAAAARHTTPPDSAPAGHSAFGDRSPNPLPTPPRIYDVGYSRPSLYSPPNSASSTSTPSKGGVGSSSTMVSYTSPPPASAPAHGSSSTSYGIIPPPSSTSSSSTVTPSRASTGVSSASASAAASASAQASRSHRRPDRSENDSSRSRTSSQIERSYSSRETSRSREPSSTRQSSTPSRPPSREPSVSRQSSDRSRSNSSYPIFAPEGMPPIAPTQEHEARILSDLSSKYTIHGEPPRAHRERYESKYSSKSASGAGAEPPPPTSANLFEHFPLPTPPESYFVEQKRREAAKDRERQQHQPAPLVPQQSSYYRHSTSSYQTPKTSPYSSSDPSPQKSPTYPQRGQYSNGPSPQTHSRSASASRHTSPYPSPNDAPQRSPYPSPYSNASSAHPSPGPSPTKPSHASRASRSSYSNNGGGPASTSGPRRKGYWNSRGDHLTATGFIVYAPGDKANPPDLVNYPGQWSGFMDEQGGFIKFEVGRQELPESLPRYGRTPERPYESVSSFSIFASVLESADNGFPV